MTATQVGGVEVISTEPALSPHWKGRSGQPIEYRQMLRLLLADGREVFGCLHCDYTHESLNSVRPHLNKHRLAKRQAAVASVGGTSLAELARIISTAETAGAEVEEWKRRALKAEGQLRVLRKALAP